MTPLRDQTEPNGDSDRMSPILGGELMSRHEHLIGHGVNRDAARFRDHRLRQSVRQVYEVFTFGRGQVASPLGSRAVTKIADERALHAD